MEQVIVLLDDNGLALGAVHMDEGNSILVDKSGKIIQKISSKISVLHRLLQAYKRGIKHV